MQANFAKLRLAHLLADAGELDIEGVEGKQMLAAGARREQRACVTIEIAIAGDGADGSVSIACLQGLPVLRDRPRLAQARARACVFALAGVLAMPPSRLTPRINCKGAAT